VLFGQKRQWAGALQELAFFRLADEQRETSWSAENLTSKRQLLAPDLRKITAIKRFVATAQILG
jgi:hypothetical protein